MEAVQRGSRLLWSRKIGTLFLGLILAVAILALRQTLASSWYQNLGYVHLTRALLSPESGRDELASAHGSFAQAVSWQENNSGARWGLGEVYHQLGDDAAAVEQWHRTEGALSRLLAASDAAFEADNYPEALDKALLALAVDPNSSSAEYRLGEAYRALGEVDRGVAEYHRAKELNSFLPGDTGDMASCYFGEAKVYEAQENWEAAVWHYEVGLQIRPDAAAYAALGQIYHQELGDVATAMACLREAIRLEPTRIRWRVSLGDIYLSSGDYELAVAELQGAKALLDSEWDLATVHIALGRAYCGLGQHAQAIEAYEEALRLDPSSSLAERGLRECVEQ